MNADQSERRRLLLQLFRPTAPAPELMAQLGRLGWDSSQELVDLTRAHMAKVLRRFVKGDLSAEDVEKWANALEGREDVAMSSLAAQAVFSMAKPALEGELTKERALEILRRSDRPRMNRGLSRSMP